MYEELVKSLKICGTPALINENCVAFHDGCCEAEPVCMYELMRKAADAIEELTAQTRWIPVTERLPVNTKSVLIVHRGGVSTGWHNGRYWERVASTNHRPIQTVTHWMPFPEPPKEES